VPSSDVDLWTIDVGRDASSAIGEALSRRFSRICRAVNIRAARTRDCRGYTDEAYGRRVFLRHYCVHVSGVAHHESLLAVAGLVSIHDATWTTDREGSARRWAEIDPELGHDLDELVRWMDGQTVPTRAELSRMLGGLIKELVRALDSSIGLCR
jgi:hypothetical protein